MYFSQLLLQAGGTCTSCTLQILGMLLGAFLLGYLLRYFLNGKLKSANRDLMQENERQATEIQAGIAYKNGMEAEYKRMNLHISELERSKLNLDAELGLQKNTVLSLEQNLSAAMQWQDRYKEVHLSLESLQAELKAAQAAGRQADTELQKSRNRVGELELIQQKMNIDLEAGRVALSAAEKNTAQANTGLADQLKDCQSRFDAAEESRKRMADDLSKARTRIAALEEAARNAPAPPLMAVAPAATDAGKPDNLELVEGIGPKLREILNNAGIFSFRQLANTSLNDLKHLLAAAGPRYQMHDPGTWAQQAAMAADGRWPELKAWQDQLVAGRPPEGAAVPPDDLKIVEGIGPKIEEILNRAGIFTFLKLSATGPEALKKILDAEGPRYQMHDPATWPKQAGLAAAGQWEELKKLQDELTAGRE